MTERLREVRRYVERLREVRRYIRPALREPVSEGAA
jgi:hypothetical protein